MTTHAYTAATHPLPRRISTTSEDANGIHPKIASERLRHASIAITMDTYSHAIPGLQEDAALRIDAAFRNALTGV